MRLTRNGGVWVSVQSVRCLVALLVTSIVAAACTNAGPGTTVTTTESTTAVSEAIGRPPPPAPIAVVLSRPGRQTAARVGDSADLGTWVWSEEPTARLELWEGDKLVEAVDFDEPTSEATYLWSWAPGIPGLSGLVVRAFDSHGRSATSFPLWLRAIDFDPGEPPTAAAGGSSAFPTPTGPIGRLAIAEQPDGEPIEGRLGAVPSPVITIDDNSCTAGIELAPQTGASGMALYAASFGGAGFVPVDLFPSSGGNVSIPIGSAPIIVYADIYDATEAVSTRPTVITPPVSCGLAGWVGDTRLELGILANPTEAEAAYLYISTGDEIWSRVPEADQTFVYSSPDGTFDFTSLLPSDGGPLSFEAWGWGDGELRPLGRGSFTPPKVPAGPVPGRTPLWPMTPSADLDWSTPIGLVRAGMICLYPPPNTTGTGGLGTLPDECTNGPFGTIPTSFRWKPQPADLTHGIVQISSLAPPTGAALSFPGLMYAQKIAEPDGGSIEFNVDLGNVLNPPSQQASLPDSMTYQLVADLAMGAAAAGGSPQNVRLKSDPPLNSKPDTLYVRVVPMNGTQPLPGTSNLVIIDLSHEPAAPASSIYELLLESMTVDVEFVPPHLPNADYERCVRVVKNPFGSKNPAPSETPDWYIDRGMEPPQPWAFDGWYHGMELKAFSYVNGVKVNQGMVPGSTVCPWKLDSPAKDWWDHIVDGVTFVAWVWDMYVYVWDLTKDKVATAMAYASGCYTIAGEAGKSKEEALAICKGISTQVINVGLIALGAPPTLPKFNDVVEAAKGDLSDWIVELAVDAGILDCGTTLQDECEQMAKDMIDHLLDDVQEAASHAAVKTATAETDYVLMIHPGIYVIPEPAGLFSPAMYEVTFTRSSLPTAATPPASCTYVAGVSGHKADYGWQNYSAKSWQTGPVSAASVMVPRSVTVDLSGLAPGADKRAFVIVDKPAEFYLEGQHPALPGVPSDIDPKTWIFFAFPDATLTTYLSSSDPACGIFQQSFPQDAVKTEPWEIPYP